MKVPTYQPVWNYRNGTNKSGRYPIHIRIAQGYASAEYYPMNIPSGVSANEWLSNKPATNSRKKRDFGPNIWVGKSNPFAFEINCEITDKIHIIHDLIRRYYSMGKDLTVSLVLQELNKNYNTKSFIEFYEAYIKNPRESLTEGTLKRYASALAQLKRFNKVISFNDLSEDLFLDFKKYMKDDARLVNSTAKSYMDAVKRIAFWARKDNHITKERQEAIFEGVTIPVGKTKSDHLEIHEIKEWRDFQFDTKWQHLDRDRNLMLLLIYTGFYYSDLCELKKADIRQDIQYGKYIYSERYKNTNLSIVPLWKFPHALELLIKYKSEDSKSPFVLDRKFLIEDQVFNRNLKVIAKQVWGWDRKMKNRLGRKTNAQLYIRFGATRGVVSKLLGHEKEETTSAYFDINIAEIIEGTKMVDFESVGLGK